MTGSHWLRRLKRLARRLLPSGTEPAAAPPRIQEFSIGIYFGTSPSSFASPPEVVNPVLTHQSVSDVSASLVADPFMLLVDGVWYMFFEVMNVGTGKGEIALATSANGTDWKYRRIVLTEAFHLSYPYVFEWEGDFWMIPESHQAGAIRLYRASEFPDRWSFVATLVSGPRFSDSSLVRHAARWWLFTETDRTMQFATARLYFADELTGPWVEHPQSPIVEGNPRKARPGGRILVSGDRIIRYTQDCVPEYGTRVMAAEVIELTPTTYRDRELGPGPVLAGSGQGWNREGMHHIDAHPLGGDRWIACVDGWTWAAPGRLR